MFGYVLVNPQALDEAQKQRFRVCYCGLCQELKARHGNIGRLTLSNDMTFLGMLLSALYEPQEVQGCRRCMVHPAKKRAYVRNEAMAYAADMNILLAYHKCLDDAQDEGALRGKIGAHALQKAYAQVEAQHPQVCRIVRESLEKQAQLEHARCEDIDALCRPSADMLGACFAWKQDVFAPALQAMGAALGRFIYLMDAYEDYDADVRASQFNPLAQLHQQADYEKRMEDILTMEMAQCVRAFDYLPIEQDAQLLRNILYSGVWSKYAYMQQKRKEKKQ